MGLAKVLRPSISFRALLPVGRVEGPSQPRRGKRVPPPPGFL